MTEAGDAAQLDEASEREWALLHDQFELAEGFWLGFIFSPTYTAPRVMAERVERKLRAAGHALRRWQVKAPTALRNLPASVVAAAREGTTDGLWVEALENDLGDTTPEASWTAAWSEFLMRLNERREVFVRHHRGALLIVAPPWVKPLAWERSPDLWAYRAIVVEFVVRGSMTRPEFSTRLATTEDDGPLTADEERALTEVDRARASGARFTALVPPLLTAARALIRRLRRDEARALLAWALSLPREPQTPDVWIAMCLSALAMTELGVCDHTSAMLHFQQAILLGDDLDDTLAWRARDQLARLHFEAKDLVSAVQVATQALVIVRRVDARERSVDSARRLMSSIRLLGRLHGVAGGLAAAEELRTEALSLAQRWIRLFGETEATRSMLLTSLVEIGEVHKLRGAWGPAIEALSEAVTLGRRLATTPGDHPDARRNLRLALKMLAAVYSDSGRAAEATPLRDEALLLADESGADPLSSTS